MHQPHLQDRVPSIRSAVIPTKEINTRVFRIVQEEGDVGAVTDTMVCIRT